MFRYMVYCNGKFNAQFVEYYGALVYVLAVMSDGLTYEIYQEDERYNKTVERKLVFNSCRCRYEG